VSPEQLRCNDALEVSSKRQRRAKHPASRA
jgi:hypothetical protein